MSNVEFDLNIESEAVTLEQAQLEDATSHIETPVPSAPVLLDDGTVVDFKGRATRLRVEKAETTVTISALFVQGNVEVVVLPLLPVLTSKENEFYLEFFIDGILSRLRSALTVSRGKLTQEQYFAKQLAEVQRQMKSLANLELAPEALRQAPVAKASSLSWTTKAWAVLKGHQHPTICVGWVEAVEEAGAGRVAEPIGSEILAGWNMLGRSERDKMSKRYEVVTQVKYLQDKAGVTVDELVL